MLFINTNMKPIFLISSILILTASVLSCKGQHKEVNVVPKRISFSEVDREKYDSLIVAGGCFWCTEAIFERVKGVNSVFSGYAGGKSEDPTYSKVSAGLTQYAESIIIYYDPKEISYEELIVLFFDAHYPTQSNGQGPDRGQQYRPAIFYFNEEQKEAAEEVKKAISSKFDKPIATSIDFYENFYVAEKYHQDYYPDNMGNPYVQNVSRPKVEKFEKNFSSILKDEYK